MENQWTSGLFSCMDDVETACLTWFCPCVTFGRIADIADEGRNVIGSSCKKCGLCYGLLCFMVAFPWLLSCTYRTKILRKFGIPDSPATDCLIHCFCDRCALCQEYRELKNRGVDPSIGWDGNVQRKMAAPTSQKMMG
ncbi:PREDICTED: protein PLANT CADMIUM RESISTANCE 7-like [Camelina sativa]|uniref:Protein PLANT CADMIUM RESISTANCE 7-like n=1 Tax=Camelina sativa TaxID=90675 RepID=A0ABM0YWJ9_CAMSA|nr:PREDICTED: protein PLANT CADMIUM RESISTANCE 7-like [Camelina sativa]